MLLPEMPVNPGSSELFLIIVVYYGITNDTGKIIEEMDFNESFTSARQMKLYHENNALHYFTVRYSASAKTLSSVPPPPFSFTHAHKNEKVD